MRTYPNTKIQWSDDIIVSQSLPISQEQGGSTSRGSQQVSSRNLWFVGNIVGLYAASSTGSKDNTNKLHDAKDKL